MGLRTAFPVGIGEVIRNRSIVAGPLADAILPIGNMRTVLVAAMAIENLAVPLTPLLVQRQPRRLSCSRSVIALVLRTRATNTIHQNAAFISEV